ncbi:MAG: M48 family metalloprotease, partial [Clostridiales bacterium]|nr:M48 family metalloprotease [Clostridiales bacterium]
MKKGKSFYIGDFFKSFFKAYNIPIMIYLFMNIICVYLGVALFPYLCSRIFSSEKIIALADSVTSAYYIYCAVFIFIVYFLSVFFSLSPLGEWALRKRMRCKKIKNSAVVKRIYPLFKEVYLRAMRLDSSLTDGVKLFIQADNSPNAFAVGRKSVCVTTGLLNLTDDEIKGILGHEFGHLAHKDTDLNLVVNISNVLINIVFLILWMFVISLAFVFKVYFLMLSFMSENKHSSFRETLMQIISLFAVFAVVNIIRRVWFSLGNLLLLASSRGKEYKADEFSCLLGYKSEMLSFFEMLPDSGKKGKLRRFISSISTVGATHPA